MLFSGLMGVLIGITYQMSFDRYSYSSSFKSTVSLICIIITGIIISIGSNIALSLGLVGSLSIIRFRTVIKDTMEMVFLFWSIATGIAIGAGQILLSAIIFITVLVYLLISKNNILNYYKNLTYISYSLSIKKKIETDINFDSSLDAILEKKILVSEFKNTKENEVETNYLIIINNKYEKESLQKIRKIFSKSKIISFQIVKEQS